MRHHDDAASLELALIENMVREDLNPVEEARACAALVEELGLTREEVGLRVGRSRVAVSNLLRLLDLPDEALELLEARELTEGHGRALLLRRGPRRRRELARQAAARAGRFASSKRERATAAADAVRVGDGLAATAAPASSTRTSQAAIEQIADRARLGARRRHRRQPRRHGYTAQIASRRSMRPWTLARRLRVQRAA